MSDQGQPSSSGWVSRVALLTAGGLLGMTALAGVIFFVMSALAANVMVWFLVLPYVVGGPEIWIVTIAIFLAIGVGTCFLSFVAVRALYRYFQRRIQEAKNDGVQV